MYWILSPLLIISVTILFLFSLIFIRLRRRRHNKRSVAFFHPYTNDGGGGERVLWCSVKAIQDECPDLEIHIYTGDQEATPDSLSTRAIDRFGVSLSSPPQVVHLHKRKWVEASSYPRFTMIGQSLGSIYLAWEALTKLTPTYFFDTSGYAFTYPVARIFGCKVLCYIHYPTISSDMISRVRRRNSLYNNNSTIALRLDHHNTNLFLTYEARLSPSGWLSRCKLVYYLVFSWLYGLVGSCAHMSMVNSSWTEMHIRNLWKNHSKINLVYPPCNTRVLEELPLERPAGTDALISVAQFRPEKDHGLQLEAFCLALKRLGSEFPMPKLQFVGSCRNEEDEERVSKLREKAREMNVERLVEFHKNVTYNDLVRLLGGAIAGIHSMIDEHFGISVVEYMAAGAIPIAHNSAGPKMDIVVEEEGAKTGFLAENVDEYAEAIMKVVRMPDYLRIQMAAAARRRATSFSDERFYRDFKLALNPVFSPK